MADVPRVRTSAGIVAGRWQGDVAVFRGIPFAAPPVGTHRFAAPHPAQPWDGVRTADAFGPPPPQPGRPPGGDDWLTLAVWTPHPGAARLPVVVWISGGAYLQCDTANPHLDGTVLARGGAVVVSANYRTGVEGFLHLDGAPDNRGLLDQVAALRWVQDNVAGFGGDPGNVTVFGESAGAGSVAALLVMPTAAGLFRRAIVQSVPATYFAPALAGDIATTVAAEVAARPCLDQLAAIAPAELVAAARAVTDRLPGCGDRWGPVAYTPTPFSPVIDGETLPSPPWSALRTGSHVPVMVAHVRDEFRMLANRLGRITDDGQVDALIDGLVPDPGAPAYRAAFPSASAAELHELVLADWLMRMPTAHLADALHAGGAAVWMSELCWGFGPQGASHGLDTLLVFGTADVNGEITAAGPAECATAEHLSELMRAEYLAFAATGDPGWARYEPVGLPTRVYDVEPVVERYPEERSLDIWRDHRFGVLDLS